MAVTIYKTKCETVTRLGKSKIERSVDYWGGVTYILSRNGVFVERSIYFNELRDHMYELERRFAE